MLLKKHSKKSLAKKPARARPAPANKRTARIAAPGKPVATAKTAARNVLPAPEGSRFALYVYWVIILFFVGATCYIMGRSYSIMHRGGAEMKSAAMINVSGMSEVQRRELANEYSAAGKEKLLAGNATGAILDLTVALEADPKMIEAFIFRGEAYMQVSDYSRAMADFNKAIDLDPDNAVAFYDRAILSIRLEELDVALLNMNLALDANQRRPSDIVSMRDIYSRRAQLHLWSKDFQQAVNDYTAALNASDDGQSPDDFAGRAEAWTALGEFRHATSDYLSAITLISERIQIVETAAQRDHMSRAAMSYFERSAALNVQLGDMESARTDLEAAHTLAAALGDNDTASRIQSLIMDL